VGGGGGARAREGLSRSLPPTAASRDSFVSWRLKLTSRAFLRYYWCGKYRLTSGRASGWCRVGLGGEPSSAAEAASARHRPTPPNPARLSTPSPHPFPKVLSLCFSSVHHHHHPLTYLSCSPESVCVECPFPFFVSFRFVSLRERERRESQIPSPVSPSRTSVRPRASTRRLRPPAPAAELPAMDGSGEDAFFMTVFKVSASDSRAGRELPLLLSLDPSSVATPPSPRLRPVRTPLRRSPQLTSDRPTRPADPSPRPQILPCTRKVRPSCGSKIF
jgi:hypothetical protein